MSKAIAVVAALSMFVMACGQNTVSEIGSNASKGTAALTLQPSASEADGVAGFNIEVYDSATPTPNLVDQDYVLLHAEHLPSGFVPDAGDSHDFASANFVLLPGSYHVKAYPMKLESVPSSACAMAEADLQITAGENTTLSLVSQCTGTDNGGADIVAALNNPPQILDVTYDPSSFVSTCENLGITLTAQDPDGDALTYAWNVTNAPEGTPANSNSVDLERDSQQYLSISDANQTGLDVFSALTFEMWVRFESVLQNENDIFGLISKYNSGGGVGMRQYIWKIWRTGDSTLINIEVVNDTLGEGVYQEYNFSVNTWYHLAVTWNGSTKEFKFYVDGTQVGSTQVGTNVSQITDKSLNFEVGIDDAQHYGYRFFDGLMDEVRVWNVERSAAEISANMNKMIDSAPGLVGSWHLSNSLVDSSGNGNDLTNNNGAVFSTEVPFTGGEVYAASNTGNLFSFTGYMPGEYTVQAQACDPFSSCSAINLPIHVFGTECAP